MMTSLWIPGLFLVVLIGSVSSQRNVTETLDVTNGASWGKWWEAEYCPTGTYAHKFRLLVENDCGLCDDTGLNGIEMECYAEGGGGFYGTITSGQGQWGGYRDSHECLVVGEYTFFITRFSLRVEGDQGIGDDTAAGNLRVECREKSGDSTYLLEGDGTGWGGWGGWSSECPQGSAVCGMETRVEPPQGTGDDTAFNNMRLLCCND